MAKEVAKKSAPAQKKEKALFVQEADEKALAVYAVEVGSEEHLAQEEMELPFLKLAQKSTGQVDSDSPKYIKGLKPGQFFNTVSSEIYDEEELKVQVHGYFRNFTIWKGPKGNGEFQGSMTPEEFREFEKTSTLARDGGDYVHTVDGESLRYTDTRNFIVFLPEHEEAGILLYPMSSTGIKPAKNWNTMNMGRKASGKQMQRYMTLWGVKTDGFTHDGFPYKQVSKIRPLGWVNEDLREFGASMVDFVDAIKALGVKYSEVSDAEAADDSDF